MPAEAYTFLRPRAMQRAEPAARAGYAIPLFLIIEHEHARRAERLPCDRALALLQPVDRPAVTEGLSCSQSTIRSWFPWQNSCEKK